MTAYSFKKRFIAPICVGLDVPIPPLVGLKIAAGLEIVPKRQTIRAHGKRRHARPGETLQLYHGMRTKQCFKIGEARCTQVREIQINVMPRTLAVTRDGLPFVKAAIEEFARMDGFASVEDMAAFWRSEHPGIEKFEGVVVEWVPL